MARIERRFTVAKPLGEVVEYLKDFSHAEQWDPGTVTCTRLDTGPVMEGSTWRNVSQFLGRRTELTYRLDRALPDRLTFAGENGSAVTVDDLAFEPDGAGTRVTYTADIRLRGAARLAEPLARVALEGMAGKVVVKMQETINGL
ncbi:SRPBCC family protein [Actinocrinis puniceicyclus]|uniref:SRPBCC family protein n=1 Tax=Actinocrinis puniceicyclus TaxID=977794 RepID=A0A8J7WRI5_9ACTN|nr:SRPBCC family protein [Actinocrinis puniceicyclus]MBS2965345.1 SRPBCC family protein [Actinocrinis puniceicyclus]